MNNKRPPMRPLTDIESEHCAKLIRRGGEMVVAALLGSTDGTIRGWMKKDRWPEPMIEKMMALALEDVPRKATRTKHKPGPASRLQVTLTRSELSYYRED